jgi:hypothetical protein
MRYLFIVPSLTPEANPVPFLSLSLLLCVVVHNKAANVYTHESIILEALVVMSLSQQVCLTVNTLGSHV